MGISFFHFLRVDLHDTYEILSHIFEETISDTFAFLMLAFVFFSLQGRGGGVLPRK